MRVVLKLGLKLNLWKPIGHNAILGNPCNWFKASLDYGLKEKIELSTRWEVWQINQKGTYVGSLTPLQQQYEIGVVFSPHAVLSKLRTGDFGISYPRHPK